MHTYRYEQKLAKWWFSPKFPWAQYEKVTSYRPQGLSLRLNNWIRTWLIHPVKRRIAKHYLAVLKQTTGLKVVAITGSAGKTTTKEMIASIVKRKGETVSSLANIDPIYNIPTTILKCRPSTKYLVLEMGVEYPGEMDFYLWLAKPDISIITNIYPTHLLYFENVEGVLKEKEKIAKAVGRKGYLILNSASNFSGKIAKISGARRLFFGKGGDVIAEGIKYTKDYKTDCTINIKGKKVKVRLPLLGRHFVENALAAATVGYALGINFKQIKKGLEKFQIPEHRMKVKKLRSGAILIDDSYNNNPAAARESLATFKQISQGRDGVVVFGDMLELGTMEIEAHKEIGRLIAAIKPKKTIFVGTLAAISSREARKELKEGVIWVPDAAEALKILKVNLNKNQLILIKGSRAIGLEKMVSGLS